jgi:hypothetical protein
MAKIPLENVWSFLPCKAMSTILELNDICHNTVLYVLICLKCVYNADFDIPCVKVAIVPGPLLVCWRQNFSPLNRTKEFSTVECPSPTQAQESQDSSRDWSKSIVLSRLSCTCLDEGESTVLNSFVRLKGLKFSSLTPELQSPIHIYGRYFWLKSLVPYCPDFPAPVWARGSRSYQILSYTVEVTEVLGPGPKTSIPSTVRKKLVLSSPPRPHRRRKVRTVQETGRNLLYCTDFPAAVWARWTRLNSFVRLRGLKFSALYAQQRIYDEEV